MATLTPAQAATEIRNLINRSPCTPSAANFEAIIARVSHGPDPVPDPEGAALLAEMRRVRLLYLEANRAYVDDENNAALEAKSNALDEEFQGLARRAVQQRPIRSWVDVAMYAEICLSWDMGALYELLYGDSRVQDLMSLVAAVAHMAGCPIMPIAREDFERCAKDDWRPQDVGWVARFIEPGIPARRPPP